MIQKIACIIVGGFFCPQLKPHFGGASSPYQKKMKKYVVFCHPAASNY